MVTLTLPAGKVVWQKKGKELNINGKLFDIKSCHFSGGILTATGFYDEDEVSLFRLLSAFTSPEKNKAFLHFLLVLQCFAAPVFFLLPGTARQRKIIHHAFFCLALPRPFCQPAKRPPQANSPLPSFSPYW